MKAPLIGPSDYGHACRWELIRAGYFARHGRDQEAFECQQKADHFFELMQTQSSEESADGI